LSDTSASIDTRSPLAELRSTRHLGLSAHGSLDAPGRNGAGGGDGDGGGGGGCGGRVMPAPQKRKLPHRKHDDCELLQPEAASAKTRQELQSS